ncbi:MAG: TlpA family protein disulfide reductase [Gemmatimonadales bacterium]|nr:TlpA family protein disulfide reductase [Gemmatimonadales bacterium]
MTSPDPGRPRWRRWLSLSNLVLLALWVFILVRVGPHLAALVGFETGDRTRPTYAVTTLDGRLIEADSLAGRVVLVNFWATWCPPCRVEMPLLEAMHQRHRDRGLVVLGLSVDTDPAERVRAFLTERGITYPVAIVGAREQMAFGGVAGYPTSFLLDRQGRIRHRAMGPLAMASFEPAVRRLLEEPAPRTGSAIGLEALPSDDPPRAHVDGPGRFQPGIARAAPVDPGAILPRP